MPKYLGRRDFIVSAALIGAAAPLLSRLRASPSEPPYADGRFVGMPFAPAALPFALSQVRLRAGIQHTALMKNRAFMMDMDPDRLLHTFRINAGLVSKAKPIGGWEAPENELRGHFTGHYLSACALMAAATGDPQVKARGAYMIAELAKCQQALGGEYLSAFPTEFFDRLRAGRNVWAPWYTYHKIMAGLLDSHAMSGNVQALGMVKGMAAYAKRWSDSLSSEQMAKTLDREFGGMNEVLYDLWAVTHDDSHAVLAHRFDHEKVFAPLADHRDELKGVHGNTTIPKIIGAARRYELTGEPRYRDVAEFFWDDVTGRRCYATGGTTNDESWNTPPAMLSKDLGSLTQESCVSYNMLRLTRHLISWHPDAAYGDYYERTYFNGILPTQHPADGEKAYYTPLAAGFWKMFGAKDEAFWCCHGTGVESFSKLADSVYFRDDAGIFVSLFVPSELTWAEKGVRIIQDTAFPSGDRVTLTVHCDTPTQFALRIRVPYWATQRGEATLNKRPAPPLPAPSNWYVMDRMWTTGDTLELTLPMSLHAHPMPDDPQLQAVMFGPLVLVAKLGTDGVHRDGPTKPRMVPEFSKTEIASAPPAPSFVARSSELSSWITPVPGRPLEFRTVGQATDVTLVPLHTLFDERYAVYFRIT
ncbi:MAG: hypothetical protein JWM95_1622 [Gemmatimonadetes bacterium]|nr:hypothetical protein [Gemmatimonadota bacterium]